MDDSVQKPLSLNLARAKWIQGVKRSLFTVCTENALGNRRLGSRAIQYSASAQKLRATVVNRAVYTR